MSGPRNNPDDDAIVALRQRLDRDLQRLVAHALAQADDAAVARFRTELDGLPTTYSRGLLDAAADILNEEGDAVTFEDFLAVDYYDDLVTEWLRDIVDGLQPIPDSLRLAYQRSPQAGDDYDRWAAPP